MDRFDLRHDTWTRRDLLASASTAALGALAAGAPRRAIAEDTRPPVATADSCIVLWMAGGMAHTETFDPKRHTPFRKGLPANDVLSTFPSIPTAVDGVRFSEGLEKTAAVMDRGTLIRTAIAGDLGKILHSRHQYHWHTGYEPPLTVAAPHLGAWIAQALGPATQRSRPSSTSDSVTKATARPKNSRPSRPPDSSAANTARSESPIPGRPFRRSAPQPA